MRPKTEEFLYTLLWAADKFARPTFHNLDESFESWAYRNGLLRQIGRLESRKLIERDTQTPRGRLYRLTEQGRLHALGGRDPERQWSRSWDGLWRLAVFDVPVTQNVRRGKLRRYLISRGFGCLQGSVWVTPDDVHAERRILTGGKIDVGDLVLFD